MQGRFHIYEGYSLQQVTLPIRVMKLLGVKWLLLSNAAGAINKPTGKGDLMLLDDHIDLLPANPLTGKSRRTGGRYRIWVAPTHPQLNRQMETVAKSLDITLHKGVYAVVAGQKTLKHALNTATWEWWRRCGRHVDRTRSNCGEPYGVACASRAR